MNGFWQIVGSNALIVVPMALGVALLGRVWKNPQGRHLLWLLVLVKLLAPPIVTIPVVVPSGKLPALEAMVPREGQSGLHPANESIAGDGRDFVAPTGAGPSLGHQPTAPLERAVPATAWLDRMSWLGFAACIWAAGSLALALYYGRIIVRFHRLLAFAEPAQPMLVEMAAAIGRQLGLRRTPEIITLDARFSPLVFAIGGRPRIVLPIELCERLDAGALRTILVHEMAHIRRGDHVVRLLELVATTLFWWHPVVWWASRQLCDLSEECCDAIVLDAVSMGSRVYATAILDTLDFIVERPATLTLGSTMVRRSNSLAKRIRLLQTHAPSGQLKLRHLLSMAALVAFPLAVAIVATAAPPGAAAGNGRKSVRFETAAFNVAGETDETITFEDPTGDDDGPGTYTYPTDPVYTRGSFDLTEFSVTKTGDRVKFDVTVAAPLADLWKLRAGFSVQMVFIFIQTEDRRAPGFTETVPGLNVSFAPADAWNKLVILSPQPPARIEDEIEAKVPAPERSSIIVPDRAKGAGSTISATVDLAQLGGGDPSKWGYQVVMQSNEAFPDGFDLLTRKVNRVAGRHRFGGATDEDCDPHVMDILAGRGQGTAEEVQAQHEMLRYECNPDGTTKQGAVLKMVRK